MNKKSSLEIAFVAAQTEHKKFKEFVNASFLSSSTKKAAEKFESETEFATLLNEINDEAVLAALKKIGCDLKQLKGNEGKIKITKIEGLSAFSFQSNKERSTHLKKELSKNNQNPADIFLEKIKERYLGTKGSPAIEYLADLEARAILAREKELYLAVKSLRESINKLEAERKINEETVSTYDRLPYEDNNYDALKDLRQIYGQERDPVYDVPRFSSPYNRLNNHHKTYAPLYDAASLSEESESDGYEDINSLYDGGYSNPQSLSSKQNTAINYSKKTPAKKTTEGDYIEPQDSLVTGDSGFETADQPSDPEPLSNESGNEGYLAISAAVTRSNSIKENNQNNNQRATSLTDDYNEFLSAANTLLNAEELSQNILSHYNLPPETAAPYTYQDVTISSSDKRDINFKSLMLEIKKSVTGAQNLAKNIIEKNCYAKNEITKLENFLSEIKEIFTINGKNILPGQSNGYMASLQAVISDFQRDFKTQEEVEYLKSKENFALAIRGDLAYTALGNNSNKKSLNEGNNIKSAFAQISQMVTEVMQPEITQKDELKNNITEKMAELGKAVEKSKPLSAAFEQFKKSADVLIRDMAKEDSASKKVSGIKSAHQLNPDDRSYTIV